MAQREREGRGGGGGGGAEEKQRSFALGAENLTQLTLLPNQNFPPTLSSRLSFPHPFPSLGGGKYGERREQQPLHAIPFPPSQEDENGRTTDTDTRRHNWTTSLSPACFSFSFLSLFLLSESFSRAKHFGRKKQYRI